MSETVKALRDAREKVREAESVLAAAISHFDHCLDTVQKSLLDSGQIKEEDLLTVPEAS